MISLEKLRILTHLQNLPANVGDLGKLIAAKGFEKLPKVQKIAKSGHTVMRCLKDLITTSPLLTQKCFKNDHRRQLVQCVLISFQLIASLAVSVGCVTYGICMAYTSSAIPSMLQPNNTSPLTVNIGDYETTWMSKTTKIYLI